MDAQAGKAGQIQSKNIVPPVSTHCSAQHLVELHIAPGTIRAAKAAAFQFYRQLIIVRQTVFGSTHLVVEEADSGGEPLAEADYITNALCVMKWLCRDRSALCVIGQKIKRTQKVSVAQTFCVLKGQ